MNKNLGTIRRVRCKIFRWAFASLLMFLFFIMPSMPAAQAAVIEVNDSSDNLTAGDGYCTLREAITNANIGGESTSGDCTSGVIGIDTIIVPAGIYHLSLIGVGENDNATGDLDILDDIIINGAGIGVTIIDGNNSDRVIHSFGSVNMDINNLTIQNGQVGTIAASSDYGGGIYHLSSGMMNLTHVEVVDNLAGHRGGGIENAGIATLTMCIVSGNQSNYGGGLVSFKDTAETTIINSLFTANSADTFGGGVYVYRGQVTVKNSTFTDNQGPGNGGGLANRGQLTIINSTISGNQTTGDGGGIYTHGGTTTVSNSTLTGNTNGDGIYNGGGTITLANSIVSDNSVANCTGAITDDGNNLEFNSENPATTTCGGFTIADPLLGILADNGGPTKTHALGVGSPAIDAGNDATCEANDQRGATRPMDGNADNSSTCDIGAYELGELQCGILADEEPNTYQFIGSTVSINVTSDNTGGGAELDCLRVTNIPWDHPNATGGGVDIGIKTGQYWIIHGLQSDQSTTAENYLLDLKLPHTVTPADAAVCKYPGSQGGAGWDCDRTDADSSTVWLNDVTSLSDWAVGENVGPTAVSLQSISISANSKPAAWIVTLFCVLALATGGIWLRRAWSK